MALEIDPQLEQFVRSYESPKRYQHSVRVAEFALQLAEKHRVDPGKTVLAALLHDIGRELRKKDLRRWASKYYKIDVIERRQAVLLHGKAGAAIAREQFGVDDEEVLEAITYHTTGKPGMSDLGKIIFIADNAEPERKQSTKEYRERILGLALDDVMREMVEEHVDYLQEKGKSLADVTAALYVELTRGVDILET